MLSVSVVVVVVWSLLRLLPAVGRWCLVFLLALVLVLLLWAMAVEALTAAAVSGLVPPPDEDLVLL